MPRIRTSLLFCLAGLTGCATGSLGAPSVSQVTAETRGCLMGSSSDSWLPPVAEHARLHAPAAPSCTRPLRARLPIAAPSAPISGPTAQPPTRPRRDWRLDWSEVLPDSPLPTQDSAATSAQLSQGRPPPARLRDAFRRYGFPTAGEAVADKSLDPVGDAFVGNWESEHLPPDRFMPLTGSLDLNVFRNGSIYGRAWSIDQDLRGLGVGIAWGLPEAWHLAAEIGVDPFSTLEEGRFSVLFGFSRTL